jgi:hypothetical protein
VLDSLILLCPLVWTTVDTDSKFVAGIKSTNTGGQFAAVVIDTSSALCIAIYLREFLEKIEILI